MMAANGYGPAPVAGHMGRIPNYGKTQVNPMGYAEAPACIQNAMMTKDKKPFTYTPGGLDLSQIRTPSMARRMARQRSMEDHDQSQPQLQANGNNYRPQGGPAPPPPPPPQMPGPPPPPPLVIDVPNSKSPKPIPQGERPEIVIPENPIGMLRKTNSPYHWESEKAELDKLGPVPKFVEKVPSPLTVKMPPTNFSQQPPQTYIQQGHNNVQPQNYQYRNQTNQPESPIHRPEAQYAHQKSESPNINSPAPTREILQRQDSQFNKSPQPFTGQSPLSNGSTFSPTPNNNWKQPERRDSPSSNINPQQNRGPFTPNTQQFSPNYQNSVPANNNEAGFHTLPRTSQRNQDITNGQRNNNNIIYNNIREDTPQSPKGDSNPAPWRTNTLNRNPKDIPNQQTIQNKADSQQSYSPPWKANDSINKNQVENSYTPAWKSNNIDDGNKFNNQQQQQYTPPWVRSSQDTNNNKVQENYSPPWKTQEDSNARTNNASLPMSQNQSQAQDQPRYQSTMSIPMTPRKPNPTQEHNNLSSQKEVVFVNQEPVFYCPDSSKSVPPFVKTQKEKTKTPPPVWCQRPLEGRRSTPRELATPPRDTNQEPEWVRKSNEIQRGIREVVSPPKNHQPVQPTWSTRPSENRNTENISSIQGNRNIPVQMEILSNRDQNRQGINQQPQLRLVIDMQNPNNQTAYSQPTQRIIRVLSPQLVRMDDSSNQADLPSLNRNVQSQENQPKTRIIPIQIEGGNGGANKSVYYHHFTQEGPPRQSKAFKVLQIITGTQDEIQDIEDQHGFTDL